MGPSWFFAPRPWRCRLPLAPKMDIRRLMKTSTSALPTSWAAIRSFSRFSVEQDAPVLDQAVGDQQRGAVGRQERRLGVRVMHRHAEDEPALAEIGGIWAFYYQDRHVAAVHDLQLAGRRIEQDEAKRGEDPRVIPPENVVDQAGDRQRRVTFAGKSAQRMPQLAHDGRRLQ